MSFNILYHNGADVNQNAACIALYIDSFAKEFLGKPIQIDLESLTKVAAALQRPDFPHQEGVEKASPFKKAANFFVWFVALRPIISDFPADIIGDDLARIENHQNVIFAYDFAVSCLEKAKLYKKDVTVELTNRIKVSHHFYSDFIEAFSAAMPATHFKMVSLLFEQMAYKVNEGASYPETI